MILIYISHRAAMRIKYNQHMQDKTNVIINASPLYSYNYLILQQKKLREINKQLINNSTELSFPFKMTFSISTAIILIHASFFPCPVLSSAPFWNPCFLCLGSQYLLLPERSPSLSSKTLGVFQRLWKQFFFFYSSCCFI